MEKETNDKPNDYSLYLAMEQKYEKLRDIIMELSQQRQSDKERIDRVQDRVDFGLSKTGQENAARLTEISVKVNTLEHFKTSGDEKLKQLEKVMGRIMTGIFWMSFTGILGGLLAVAYQIMKIKLLGG